MRVAHGRRCAPETPAAKRGRKKHYGFSRNNPHPGRPKTTQFETTQKLLCAVGVVTTRRSRSRGVSPRWRAVRAAYGRVYHNFQRHHLQRLRTLVTTSIIKSDVVPGLRPGAASLFSGGSRLRCCRCARSLVVERGFWPQTCSAGLRHGI